MRVCCLLGLLTLHTGLQACGLNDAARIQLGADTELHYRPEARSIRVSEPFTMQFQLCREGRLTTLKRFKINASMPLHRHGMNYVPRIKLQPDGIVEASGMLFHMPGHWQLQLEVVYADRVRQLKLDYQIQ